MKLLRRIKALIIAFVGRRFSFFSKPDSESDLIYGFVTKIDGEGDCIEIYNERHESWTPLHDGKSSKSAVT